MKPKVMETGQGVFRIEAVLRLLMGASLRNGRGVDVLSLLAPLTAPPRRIEQPALRSRLPSEPFLLVGLPGDHPALRALADRQKPSLPKEGLGEEGYLLEITPTRILLTAAKPAGILYGLRTLAETVQREGETLTLPACRIADWPTLRWRGMHILVNGRQNLPAIEQLITEHLPRLRLNQLILEINYNFRYRSHPEIAEEGGLMVEDCRRLRERADRNNVRLIPMINCLGHQSWAERTGKFLTAHPEFDETPDLPPNNPGIYCRSWCPSHPDVNRVVFALFDELIDAFRADAFHVGLDEVFILGECPRCKGKDNADLFAKAVNDYHGHLVGRRKVQMMMWGDRLLDSATTPYGTWEASANGTAPAIDRIPKDIVICDWHYEKTDYPSVKHFLDKGFPVWPAGWNKEENAARLVETALANRGERMMGYLATTWGSVDALASGLAGDEKTLSSQNMAGLKAAILKAAQMAWEGARAR